MNNLNLDFTTKPYFSYGYSLGQNSPPTILDINIGVGLLLKKQEVGSVDFRFEDLIKTNTKFSLEDGDKEPTIALYEKMIEQLQGEINKLK
jgi:hypothetical protein